MDAIKHLRKNSILVIVIFLIFLTTTGFSQYDTLKLSSVKGSNESEGIEIYLGGGYFKEMFNNKGPEYYFSSGVTFQLDWELDLYMGFFLDWVTDKNLLAVTDKDFLMFPGLEFGLRYYPFGDTFIRPFLGIQVAVTLFPAPFTRNSFAGGIKIPLGSTFRITGQYSINYATSSKLNEYFSHFASIYVSFRL